jgi:hypothetical protein
LDFIAVCVIFSLVLGIVLSKKILQPGWTYTVPFLRDIYEIQVTTQTDAVSNVPCRTNNGVAMNFPSISVVNRLPPEHVFEVLKRYSPSYDQHLIFSKIPAAMMQFCSKHSQSGEELKNSLKTDQVGLEIIEVRFNKPEIPKEMANQYAKLQQLETDNANQLGKGCGRVPKD